MNLNQTRREVLRATGVAVGVALLPFHSGFSQVAYGNLSRTQLTDRLSVISGAGANVVVFETPEGLALVDSGAPEAADALMAFIRDEFNGAPIRALFNTHWHLPHTGANQAIAQQGATIIAHENTRLWMSTEYYVEWEKKNYAPRPESAWPTVTFYPSDPQPLSYEVGGYRIEYGHLPQAHTDGDIYVLFPDDNVIAVGDVLAVEALPLLDYSTGGWIGGCQDATRLLLELTNSQTQIVAADGPMQMRTALEAQAELLDELRERIQVRMVQGKSVDEILAENIMQGYESLPDPRRFVYNVYQGFWWGGRLRGPI